VQNKTKGGLKYDKINIIFILWFVFHKYSFCAKDDPKQKQSTKNKD
jgi:hypothetical protein